MRRALIAAACLALILSACADGPRAGAGDGDPAAAIRDAVERTLEAGSARIDFEMISRVGARSESVDGAAELIYGDGDPEHVQAHLTLHVPDVGAAPGGDVEVIVDEGPVVYLHAEALAQMLPVPTPWIKLDPAAMGQAWTDMPGIGSAATDPSDALDLLHGVVEVQELGPATIDGEPATHYRATVDLQAALERVPEDRRGQIREAIAKLREQTGGDVPELPFDVWLAEGLLKRVGFELALPGGVDGGAGLSATLTFSDVGGTFAIDPPPADQVTDLSQLSGMFGGAGVDTSSA
jgi:hypothetical protein